MWAISSINFWKINFRPRRINNSEKKEFAIYKETDKCHKNGTVLDERVHSKE